MASILGLASMPGAGKSTACRHYTEKYLVTVLYFGQLVLDEVERCGLPAGPESEKLVREDWRAKDGPAAIAKAAIPAIQHALSSNSHILIDGIRNGAEVEVLKEAFGDDFRMLAIHTNTTDRYERLAVRTVRPLTKEEAAARDLAEVKGNDQGASIALADWHAINHFGSEFFKQQLDTIWLEFLKA